MRTATTTRRYPNLILLSLLFMAVSPPSGAADAPTTTALATRLQRLEDIESIRRLLLDYGRLFDTRDFEGYSKLFANDGEWIGGNSTRVAGPAAIKAMVDRLAPNLGSLSNYHLITNEIIEIDGDRATASSRWSYVTPDKPDQPDSKPVLLLSGHYDDVLVRQQGRWKFQRRVVHGDIPFLDPLAPRRP